MWVAGNLCDCNTAMEVEGRIRLPPVVSEEVDYRQPEWGESPQIKGAANASSTRCTYLAHPGTRFEGVMISAAAYPGSHGVAVVLLGRSVPQETVDIIINHMEMT